MPERGSLGRGPQVRGRPPRQLVCRLAGQPQLDSIAVGLLEVVTEDLVQLDQVGAVALEPNREALVQLCTCRLREPVVRRVADQEMAEPEGVVAGQLCPIGPDELLPDERHQLRRHVLLVGLERLDATAVEDLPLDGAALEYAALGRIELIETRGKQRLDRRRHDDLAVAGLGDHREHLLDEEWVAFGRLTDPLAQSFREHGIAEEPLDQLVGLVRGERLEQDRGRIELAACPGRAPIEQLRARDTEQEDRRVATPVGDVVDEVKKCRLGPVDVVEDADDRRRLLEQLAERPRDLVRRRRLIGLAEQRRNGGRRARVGGTPAELQHDFDERPVRDPFAVREAAPSDDSDVVERRDELGGEPRLADSRGTKNGEEMACGLRTHAFPCVVESAPLALTTDDRNVEATNELAARGDEHVRGYRLRLSFEVEPPLLAEVDCAPCKPGCLRADQDLAGLRSLLETRSDVDCVARGKALLGPGHDLAGVNADAATDSELGQCVAHLDRGSASA